MNDFSQLTPHLRSLALVGNYLQHWAVMESALNAALGAALKLDSLTLLVVAKNIQLRDKIKIVLTSIDRSFMKEEIVGTHKKTVQTISNISHFRNMIAHDMFVHSEVTDGVEFFVTKASGKLQLMRTDVSIAEFSEKTEQLIQLSKDLDTITSDLQKADNIRSVAEALNSSPNRLIEALSPLGVPSRPSQEPQSYPPASEQKSSEKPQDPPSEGEEA